MDPHTDSDTAKRDLDSFHDLDNVIAVVGLDLKAPGDASSAEAFFDMLVQGKSASSEIPSNRFNIDAFYHPDRQRCGAIHTRKGHFLREDVASIDAPFFSMSPSEAGWVDPQQRLLLECTYRAFENAGMTLSDVAGTETGACIGSSSHEFDDIAKKDPELEGVKYGAVGLSTCMLANRLSWFYDLHGPSLTLDSACSSSLVALHLAVNSLKSGETSMAIAGGANTLLGPENWVPMSLFGMLAPDGKSKSFDESANGYSRGEGAGIVVLKRLRDAIRDGNTIRAVIRGTSSNQDGRTPGVTRPSKTQQMKATSRAYEIAGLGLESTKYFESHGTGTTVGDATEADAIASVFRTYRSAESPLFVGAAKSNVGHLEGAAGAVALIKTILSVEKGVIPQNLWLNKVSPQIRADEWNLKFPTVTTVWPQGFRRASINGFGSGGSNAHAILEDALHFLSSRGLMANHVTVENPALPGIFTNGIQSVELSSAVLESKGHDRIFILSTFDEAGIGRIADAFAQHFSKDQVQGGEDELLDNLCHTLASRRTMFTWKTAVTANSISSLVQMLQDKPKPIRSNPDSRLAFVFTGQGAQWVGMGKELMSAFVFKASIEAASDYLHQLGSSFSLIAELENVGTDATVNINDPAYSQPMCTALQVALVELISSWGLKPVAVVGHSSGEIAAAFAAGAISRKSAWRLAYYRGVLSSTLAQLSEASPAGMLAVGLGPGEAQQYIGNLDPGQASTTAIACINSPKSVTISGLVSSIDALKKTLDADSVFNRALKVNNGYHSVHMEPIAVFYERLVGDFEEEELTISETPKYFSSLTGKLADPKELRSAKYWVDNLISPVRFSDAVMSMIAALKSKARKANTSGITTHPITEFLEIGPHAALRGPIREIVDRLAQSDKITYASLLERGSSASKTILEVAGWLFCRGYSVNIEAVSQVQSGRLLVNLPGYPFNHTKKYWAEGQLSKGYRFRKHPRHELLGAPVAEFDDENAVWRNWIYISENPWILDHKVTGSILYPAAGMLVMAIEAMRQVVDPKKELSALKLKDVVFHRAMQIPETEDGLLTRFYLRAHSNGPQNSSSSWKEFELRSFNGDTWVQHCRGLISAVYESNLGTTGDAAEDHHLKDDCAQIIRHAETACSRETSAKQLYRFMREKMGLNFGTSFQNLSEIRTGNLGNCVATISAANIGAFMAHGYVQPHLIHPSTLDTLFHSGLAAITNGGRLLCDTMVPTSIKELWYNASSSARHATHRVAVNVHTIGQREKEGHITAVDPITLSPLVTVKQLLMTAVAQQGATPSGDAGLHLCFNIDWKPDTTFIEQSHALTAFPPRKGVEVAPPLQHFQDLDTLCILYLKRFVSSGDIDNYIHNMKPHYKKFIAWIRRHLDLYDRGELSLPRPDCDELSKDDKHIEALEAKLLNTSAESTLVIVMGKAMPEILRGEKDPLVVMFHDAKADEFYRNMIGSDIIYGKLCSYIDSLAHRDPSIKILEIGAGTGGATSWIMPTLMLHGEDEEGAPRFASYDFTDISPSFFEKAKKEFSSAQPYFNCKVLDIERDPADQGFQPGLYDIVVASNVMHATTNIESTLKNARKLLKPGGKLILHELTSRNYSALFPFGMLPGWWLSEESHREWGPLMNVSDWDHHLRRSGFSGVDLQFADYADSPCHVMNVMVASATVEEESPRSCAHDVIIIVDDTNLQQKVAQDLQAAILEDSSSQCKILPLEDAKSATFDQKLCVFLPELETPVLANLDDTVLATLKNATALARGILWATSNGGTTCPDPMTDLITGFARTARSENPVIKFITVAADPDDDADLTAQCIRKVFDAAFRDRQQLVDNSFRVVEGVIQIPRMLEAGYMNSAIAKQTHGVAPQPATLSDQSHRALKLVVGSPGLLDTIHYADDEAHDSPLQGVEVEIQVKAAGLNFKDLIVALGQLSEGAIGHECVGFVSRAGPGSELAIGDRVCGLVSGGFNTFARGTDSTLARVPRAMSDEEAAGFTIVFVTALVSLYKIGDIQPGESVLIHSAAGGVGQALCQLAKLRGAEVYATVGSAEKRKYIEETYQIPADHIFSSRDLTFAPGIQRATGGRGVDVVINHLSGDALHASWECIAPNGRFVEIGKTDIYASSRLSMEKFKYNVRFQAFDAVFMSKTQPGRFKSALDEVMSLWRDEKIKALDTKVYSHKEMQDAFRLMQSGKHMGKVVLKPHADDHIMVVPNLKPTYFFDGNATYLIPGGLGGIGRSLAKWMVGRGARHLILLSRSGSSKAGAVQLLSELETAGVQVMTPSCDVSDRARLEAVLEECSKSMPPIKGCIQGSMILKDSLFANMTTEAYHTAVRPKVQGTLNLHECLPTDMDFFVMLSSSAGIVGRQGQTNYCVGNTYQDALARHRVSRGLKATALDLGIVLDAGYVANTLGVEQIQALRDNGYTELEERELHAIMDSLCDPANSVGSPLKSQIVLGCETPESMRSRGIMEDPWWVQDPLFRHLYNIRTSAAADSASGSDVQDHKALLAAAMTRDEAEIIACKAFITKLARVLSIAAPDIDSSRRLHDYGVDSLVSVELRTWFLKELGAEIAVFDIMGESTIRGLAGIAVGRSTLVGVFAEDAEE